MSIKQSILDVDVRPDAFIDNDCIKGYKWNIKTKYYNAMATIYSVKEKKDLDDNLAESIQATVFYFNGKEPSSFEQVISWMPLLKKVTSEVQLLICENCSYEENHKKNILDWCIENQFELVELQEELNEEDEDVIPNHSGYHRVREALHTCSWSDLILTNDTSNKKATESKNAVQSEATGSEKNVNSEEKCRTVRVGDDEAKLEAEWLQKILEQDESGEESFEALFASFASMKEKAAGLHGEEKRKYAEKVAIAFCKAIGCEDEVEGLDDD